MKYLQPVQTHRKSKRGSTLCSSLLWVADVSCLNHIGGGGCCSGLPQNVPLVQQILWSVKSLLTLKWTREIFIYSNRSHSPSFTTGGHGYSRLCLLVAIKDFKDGAANTLALRLTTWPSDAPLLVSCNRKWTKDYSDHNQSEDKKRGLHTRGY